MKHRRKALGRICVSIVTLLLILGGAEWYFRLKRQVEGDVPRDVRIHDFFHYDENGCFRIQPNAKGWYRSYDGKVPNLVRINSVGIRGPELDARHAMRIAFVGDSITFDGGVPEDKTFVARIEETLNKWRLGGHGRWECLNFGTTDAGVDEYVLKLKHHVLETKPDAVVVCFYLNDSRPPQGFLGETGKASWEHKLERSKLYNLITVRKLHRHMRVVRYGSHPELLNRFKWAPRFAGKLYRRDSRDWRMLVKEAQYDWGAAWKRDTWAGVEDGFKQLKDLCASQNIPLLWVCFPVSPQVEIPADFPDRTYPQEMCANVAAKLRIPFHDLLPALTVAGSGVFSDQCHLNVRGNDVVAQRLTPWLRDQLVPQQAK